MGKLVVNEFMTLDGVMQGPGRPDEDTSGGFAHGGWQAPYVDAEAFGIIREQIDRADALLLGRRTYDIFAGYWPRAPEDDPIARKLNAMPKHVASRTLKSVAWRHSSLLGSELPREIKALKAKHDEILVFGSGDLLQTLLRERLVDRLRLWMFPLVLGSGKRVFAPGAPPAALKLARSQAFGNGALLLDYEPAGVPTYGTIGEEE